MSTQEGTEPCILTIHISGKHPYVKSTTRAIEMKATQTGIESNKTGAYGQQPSLELLKSKYTHKVNLI